MENPKFPMINQFSSQCQKRQPVTNSFMETTKKYVFDYLFLICLWLHFDVPDEFARFLLRDSRKDDNERIQVFGNEAIKIFEFIEHLVGRLLNS